MIEIVRNLDRESWSRFVLDHPDGNIFHTPEMFDVYERAANHTPQLWAAVETHSGGNGAGGEEHLLALFLPVEITVLGGPLRRLTTRAVVFGSILCQPGAKGEQALARVLEVYRQEADGRVLFTELRNITPLGPLRPVLEREGFAYEEHLNFLVDLDRPAEEILQAITKRTRKRIRSGLRKGDVVVEDVQDSHGLAECYALLRATYAAAEVPLAGVALFEAALEILVPRGMARFFLARVEGKPAACSVELLYKDRSYGWYGGTDREFSSYNPTEILYWHVFEWSAANGYRVYDFGGAGKPDEEYGVRDFKSKFGGELVEYGRNTCVHAPLLLRASKMGYSVARRLKLFGKSSEIDSDGAHLSDGETRKGQDNGHDVDEQEPATEHAGADRE